MPHDFKPLQRIVFFICVQTCFLQGDADLFFHGIDAVQVGQQKTSAVSLGDNDAVSLYIQLVRRRYSLRFPENIDSDLQFVQLRGADGRKTRVFCGRAHRILRDLLCNAAAGGGDRSDAATKAAVFVNRHENTGASVQKVALRCPDLFRIL